MKRNTLIAVVLCMMMITTAGAGAKSAKKENPRQAGKSSIYFYDVEATDNHGYGRLIIDTDKNTFTFIGQDFKPDQRVYLQFKTDGDFAVFASGKSTPSGNLHVAGTWELDAFPEVVGAVYYLYPPAYGFSLTNDGGFMAKLAVYWTTDTEWANPVEPTWHETSKATDSFGLNKSRIVNLKEFGDIPEGAWVRIHAIVVGGKDRTSSEYYTYASGQCYIPGFCYPDYTISRTTWNPILEWWRTDCYCGALASDSVKLEEDEMKKILLMILCFFLVAGFAQAGAGGNSAKQDDNPRHAGKSSIYFYDIEATDTHGYGQIVIDVDKHTFVFIGRAFTPLAHIELRARAVNSTDYVLFASGKTTPSGNLHVAGTWEEDAPPAEVATSYAHVYALELVNNGWFVAKIACYYSIDGGVTWNESASTDGIAITQWDWVKLGDLGVPDYALVKIHAIVVGGKDRTGGEVFQYYYTTVEDWRYVARYDISGVTWNPDLDYYGYFCCYTGN